MNANYVPIQGSESHISGPGIAVITAISMIMPEVPAFHVHQIGDLLKILSRRAWSNLVYAVVKPEFIPA